MPEFCENVMPPEDLPPVDTKKKKKEKFISPLSPRKTFFSVWREFRAEKKYLLLCFLVPALIMWVMYILNLVFPFGDNSVLVLDLNGQYVYFFEGYRDILNGNGSLLYSFSRALGGDFIGLFAYYLSSPFSLIVALFPKKLITEALLLMFLLKVGACGLTFGIYIESTRERNRMATVAFSTMYALCAYGVVMQHNTMWFDNMILLPIIMLGIENLIKYKKYKLFVISLSLAVFSNFYIGYMSCIFCAAYFFYYYFSQTPKTRNPLSEKAHFIKSLGRMVLFSAIAVGICSALLIGTYYSLSFGKTTFSLPNYMPEQKFDWLDAMTKLFIGSYDTVRPEGLPFLYSGTLTLMLLPLYFIAPHIKTREKISSGVLILFFAVSMNVSTADLFWHGMQRPNWLNYRYSYMLCFFMILFAYKAYEKLRDIGFRKVIATAGVTALIMILIQKQNYENVTTFGTIWLTLALLGIYICILRGVTLDKDTAKRASCAILAIVVGAEMLIAGLLNMDSLNTDVRYSSRLSYRSFIDSVRPTADNVNENDSSFFRMEKTFHRKTNDNFALGMNGLSNSTSTLNKETISLLHDFGIASKSHWSEYLGGTPVLDTLFGIKYLITKPTLDDIIEIYEETDLGMGECDVYRNQYALPIAYGVSDDIEDLEIRESFASPFERMNAVVGEMLGEGYVSVFAPAITSEEPGTEGLIASEVAGHLKFEKAEATRSGRLTYSVNITSEDVLYCYFPTDYLRECYLYVNDLKSGSVFGNDTDRITELGSFKVGDTVTVTLELTDENCYFRDGENYFYYLDSEAFEKYMPKLSENAYNIEDFSDSSFEGTIDLDEDQIIFTSIPYDEGWNIEIDGKKAKTVKLLDGLIGIKAESGHHTLTMNYFPKCVKIGIAIQLVSLAAFAAIWVTGEKRRKKLISSGVPVFEPTPDVVPDEKVFDEAESETKETADDTDTVEDITEDTAESTDTTAKAEENTTDTDSRAEEKDGE